MTLKREYSFFPNAGKRVILSYFSFNRPDPLNGTPLKRRNLDNCELKLESTNEKQVAGVTEASRVPFGARRLELLSKFKFNNIRRLRYIKYINLRFHFIQEQW